MNNLGVFVNPEIKIIVIQEHEEGDQIRKHKKKRINKKWLKKYGVYKYQKLKKGEVLFCDGVAYMSKPHYEWLKMELKSRENMRTGGFDK